MPFFVIIFENMLVTILCFLKKVHGLELSFRRKKQSKGRGIC